MITDCYTETEQRAFMDGITALEDASKKTNGKSFMDCTPQQRHDLLVMLEKEAKEFNQKRNETNKIKREAHDQVNKNLLWKEQKDFHGDPPHYYTMMKQLTLGGYFSSEIGAKQALRMPVLGKYDGNYPYKKGDKAWA